MPEYAIFRDKFNETKFLEEKWKHNKGKCGVYKWINKVDGQIYIGIFLILGLPLSNYLTINY